MKLDDIKDYGYEPRDFDFAKLFHVEQRTNNNGSVDTFYNLNDGFTISGVNELPSESVGVYTCKNGDDLRFISFDLYGTTEYWWMLAKINEMDDCTEFLKAGRKIKYLKKHYMSYIFDMVKEEI